MCDGTLTVATWVYLVTAVHDDAMPSSLIVALGFGLLAFLVLAAALSFLVLRTTIAQVVTPVLTVLYLMASNVAFATRQTVTAPVAEPRNIDGACAAVGSRYGLSPRELEVLGLLARGRTGDHIADVLGISPHTVKSHIKHIHQKMGVCSRQDIIDVLETYC